jgi:hypothetical protein
VNEDAKALMIERAKYILTMGEGELDRAIDRIERPPRFQLLHCVDKICSGRIGQNLRCCACGEATGT